jgi:hypothetical protein
LPNKLRKINQSKIKKKEKNIHLNKNPNSHKLTINSLKQQKQLNYKLKINLHTNNIAAVNECFNEFCSYFHLFIYQIQ